MEWRHLIFCIGRIVSENGSRSDRNDKNPFTMPPDYELFTLRERERNLQREVGIQFKLHCTKTTYNRREHWKGNSQSTKNQLMQVEWIRSLHQWGTQLSHQTALPLTLQAMKRLHASTRTLNLYWQQQEVNCNIHAAWCVAFISIDRRVEKEDLNSYLNKKREMFLMQVQSFWCND